MAAVRLFLVADASVKIINKSVKLWKRTRSIKDLHKYIIMSAYYLHLWYLDISKMIILNGI